MINEIRTNLSGRKTYAATISLMAYVAWSAWQGLEMDPTIITALGGCTAMFMRAGIQKSGAATSRT